MLLGDVVKKYREDRKMTMQEFADASGLSKGYISMLEKNRHPQSKRKLSPSLGTYKKVADAMRISLDDLISMIDEDSSVKINTDDNSRYHSTEGSEFTVNEIDIIEKYRTLDNYGQKIINLILDEEVERCTPSEPLLEPISIAYYHQLASAGQGEYIFDDLPTDTIRICRTAEAEDADFVLRVRGDSMEPTISDGDLLLIQKTPELKIGDIGIFIDQHDCYVKELGADGLISHNKKYPLITSASGVMCVGKVLGKAEPLHS